MLDPIDRNVDFCKKKWTKKVSNLTFKGNVKNNLNLKKDFRVRISVTVLGYNILVLTFFDNF